MTPGPRARSISHSFTSLDEGDHSLGRGHRGQGRDAWEASLNEIFWHRQQGLLQVLKAYTLYRPEQGYCQAQGPVAAVLLMHLPPEVSDLDPALRHPNPNPRYSDLRNLCSFTSSPVLATKASCLPISLALKFIIPDF